MPQFTYKAMSKDGRKLEGSIEASDRRGALAAVEKLGHVPISVSESASKKNAPSKGEPFWKLKLSGAAS